MNSENAILSFKDCSFYDNRQTLFSSMAVFRDRANEAIDR